MNAIARFVLLCLCAGALAGCSGMQIEPWVKPYERDALADPIMKFGDSQISDGYLKHVHEAREGARGASGGSGGGCGCN